VKIMSIVENSVPRSRLHATSIKVGVIILVESEADGNRIVGVLSKDNLNRELQSAGMEPMAFYVSAPAMVFDTIVKSTLPGFDVASILIPVVSISVLVGIALILGGLYARYHRASTIMPHDFDYTKPPASIKAGDFVSQSALPAAMRQDYTVENFVGSGSNSILVTAWHIQSGQKMEVLAIKLVYADGSFTEAETKQLQQESIALNRVSSPFVVALKTSFLSSSVCAIVMEYLDGDSLDKLIISEENNFSECLDPN